MAPTRCSSTCSRRSAAPDGRRSVSPVIRCTPIIAGRARRAGFLANAAAIRSDSSPWMRMALLQAQIDLPTQRSSSSVSRNNPTGTAIGLMSSRPPMPRRPRRSSSPTRRAPSSPVLPPSAPTLLAGRERPVVTRTMSRPRARRWLPGFYLAADPDLTALLRPGPDAVSPVRTHAGDRGGGNCGIRTPCSAPSGPSRNSATGSRPPRRTRLPTGPQRCQLFFRWPLRTPPRPGRYRRAGVLRDVGIPHYLRVTGGNLCRDHGLPRRDGRAGHEHRLARRTDAS